MNSGYLFPPETNSKTAAAQLRSLGTQTWVSVWGRPCSVRWFPKAQAPCCMGVLTLAKWPPSASCMWSHGKLVPTGCSSLQVPPALIPSSKAPQPLCQVRQRLSLPALEGFQVPVGAHNQPAVEERETARN